MENMLLSKMIEIEDNYENLIQELQMNSINIWLLTRDFVFNKLKTGEAKSNTNNRIKLSTKNIALALWRTQHALKQKRNLLNNRCFALTSSIFRRIVDKNSLYNFLVDPLILNQPKSLFHIELPRFNSNIPLGKIPKLIENTTYFPDLLLVKKKIIHNWRLRRKVETFLESKKSTLVSLLKQFDFCQQEIDSLIQHLIMKLVNILLIRETIAKVLSSAEINTLLVAAGSHIYIPKELHGKRIIEIQHGSIHENHPGYFFPNILKNQLREEYPRYEIALWDKMYLEILEKGDTFVKKGATRIVGFPSVYWTKRKKQDFNRVSEIIVVSQPGFAQRKLSTELAKCLKRFPNKKFILKPHPAEDNLNAYRDLLSSNRLILAPKNLDIYELITKASAIIGYNSTILEEAKIAFNKPVFYVDDSAIPAFWLDNQIGSNIELLNPETFINESQINVRNIYHKRMLHAIGEKDDK